MMRKKNIINYKSDMGKPPGEPTGKPLLKLLLSKQLSSTKPSEEDVKTYKKIFVSTQAAYKNSDVRQCPKGFRLNKYRI